MQINEEEMMAETGEILFQESTQFSKMMMRVTDALLRYTSLNYRNPVQEAGYKGFIELLKKSLPFIWQYNEFVDEELNRKLMAYHYLLKQKAEEGDGDAKIIYNDLAPGLEQILFVH